MNLPKIHAILAAIVGFSLVGPKPGQSRYAGG